MGKKLSLDLSNKNADMLEKIKHEYGIPYGQMLNYLIEMFCDLPAEINQELLDFCKERLQAIYKSKDEAGEYEEQMLVNKEQVYCNLATFFNHGNPIAIDASISLPKMQQIEMLNGYLVCPCDYIVLNKDVAMQCEYASVVEVRNAGFGVPHFLYFHTKEANKYTDADIETIEKACVKEWPRFKDIRDNVVEPIFETSSEFGWKCLNSKEVSKSPQIGHFAIYVQGDSRYSSNYKPPMDTKIVRCQ